MNHQLRDKIWKGDEHKELQCPKTMHIIQHRLHTMLCERKEMCYSTQTHRRKIKQEREEPQLGGRAQLSTKKRWRHSRPILNGTARFCPSDKLKRLCLPTSAERLPCSKQEGQLGHEQKEQAAFRAPLSRSWVPARWRVAAAKALKACAARERLHLTSGKCEGQHLLPSPLPSQRCPKKNFQRGHAAASQDPAVQRQVLGRERPSSQSQRFEILLLESSSASRHSMHHNPW